MGLKFKFSVHPLFILFGIYFAFCGKVFSFLIYTLVAVIHEFGHYCQAQKLGYRLVKLQLLPYGAVLSGDFDGLKFKDEILVALAGPLLNFILALLFVALWWLFPDAYPYTDVAMQANLTIGIINLIPAYPLDGGRVLKAGLARWLGVKRANVISRITAIVLSCGLVGVFVWLVCCGQFNLSILFFATFILVGAFSKDKQNCYVKYYCQFDSKKLIKGQQVQTLAFCEEATVKDLTAQLGESLCEVIILDKSGKIKKRFSPQKVLQIVSTSSIYQKLDKF